MTTRRSAAECAAAALALWQQERLDEAEVQYRAALAIASVDDVARGDYHGELAALLEALGKDQEAEQHLLVAVETELALAADGDVISANVARYFLAGFRVRHGEAQRALDELGPLLGGEMPGSWLLHAVAAEAWVALGKPEDADAAARRALRAAPSDDQRSELRLRFLEIGLHEAAL